MVAAPVAGVAGLRVGGGAGGALRFEVAVHGFKRAGQRIIHGDVVNIRRHLEVERYQHEVADVRLAERFRFSFAGEALVNACDAEAAFHRSHRQQLRLAGEFHRRVEPRTGGRGELRGQCEGFAGFGFQVEELRGLRGGERELSTGEAAERDRRIGG